MNEATRDDPILWQENPIRRLIGDYLIVGAHQVGIIERDGMVQVCKQGRHRVPGGMLVRCYKASTTPFPLVFWLKDPDDTTEPHEGVALDMPVLTSDGQPVTGRINLELRVMPEDVEHLLQLVPPGGGNVGTSIISHSIKNELLAKVLALDLNRYTAMELRGNESPLRDIHGSVIRELESTISRFGLRCDNFYTAWGLSSEERERIKERRHEGEVRAIQRGLAIAKAQHATTTTGSSRGEGKEDSPPKREAYPPTPAKPAPKLAAPVPLAGQPTTDQRAWVVRCGKSGTLDMADSFLNASAVAITGQDQGDDLRGRTWQDIAAELQQRDPNYWNARRLAHAKTIIERFKDMRAGDLVLAVPNANGAVLVGQCESGYQYEPGRVAEGYPHVIHVRWRPSRVPRGPLSQDLNQTIKDHAQWTVFPIDEHSSTIYPLLREGPQVGYYVYTDRVTGTSRIHRGSCRYCNYGRGIQDTRRSDNYWHGPYADLSMAECADRTRGAVIMCGTCNPQLSATT